ncbi:MAG: flagellar assembly protein FliX [Methyloligellaceae bacterium]
MRVGQARRTDAGAGKRSAGRASGQGRAFRPATAGGSQRPARLRAGPSAVANLDAIVSLQSVDEAQDLRRQAMSQGREVLDLLDELKVGVLSGGVSEAKLARLERAVGQFESVEDEPGLKDVLLEIDLRARVELAKLKRSAA